MELRPMTADDTIRDLFRNHSKKELIEVIVAQTQAAVDAELHARPEQDEAVRRWTYLYDDYDAGTVFITDDPTGEQLSIAEGLSEDTAKRICEAHNGSGATAGATSGQATPRQARESAPDTLATADVDEEAGK